MERNTWKDAYQQLFNSGSRLTETVSEQVQVIKETELTGWQKFWHAVTPQFGLFAGVSQHGEGVVGGGLVWTLGRK